MKRRQHHDSGIDIMELISLGALLFISMFLGCVYLAFTPLQLSGEADRTHEQMKAAALPPVLPLM